MLEGFSPRAQAQLIKQVGVQVTGILDTTRELIRDEIQRGLEQGLGGGALGDALEDAAAFSEYRGELIARTETAIFLNRAATETYRDYGVEHVEVIDGTDDDECAEANGSIWTLEQAEANPIAHPNCVRDFSPYFGNLPEPTAAEERSDEADAAALDKAGYQDQRGFRISEDDGMVHVYHGTTADRAALIQNSEGLQTEQGPGWYMVTTSRGQAERYAAGYNDGSGSAVLSYTLTPEEAKTLFGRGVLHTDDEFKQIVNGEPTDPLVHGLLHNLLPNKYLSK